MRCQFDFHGDDGSSHTRQCTCYKLDAKSGDALMATCTAGF